MPKAAPKKKSLIATPKMVPKSSTSSASHAEPEKNPNLEKELEKQELTMIRVLDACYSTPEQLTMGFGKHQGKTYQGMVETLRSYCEWVLTTMAIEEEACQELKHLGHYLLITGFNGRTSMDDSELSAMEEEGGQAA